MNHEFPRLNDIPRRPTRLPAWFERPQSLHNHQRSLFPVADLPAVLAELCVSPDELTRWQASGWVTFGPSRGEPIESWDVDEIHFVRDVVRSGLSDAQIARHFAELPRPMNFGPETVAYSFSLGWVAACRRPDPLEIVDEHIDDWLVELADQEDSSRLLKIRERVNTLLAAMSRPEDGGK